MKHSLTFLLSCIASFLLAQTNPAQDSAFIRDNFTKREVMIPMRDGKSLFTAIYTPKDVSKKYPILMRRTPYSCSPYGADAYATNFQNMYLARAGYIMVFQDVRGRFMSEGEFVDVRPYGQGKFDEATDTYDTVDWLLKNASGNNGNVGVLGISYPGFYATMAVLAGHPAIKAVSPQAPVTDWFVGDDFHHNGAFFLMDGFSFYSGFGKVRPKPTTDFSQAFQDWNTPDNYDFYLKAGALRNFSEKYGMKDIPFWQDLMQHPNYDAFWQARNPRPHLKNIKPAVMTVGGLFDAEDCWGAWNTYKALESQNPASHSNRIVMGPWVHGGWARGKGDRLGSVVFGQMSSDFYQREIEFKFFEHYLKGNGAMDLPEAYVFETGSNRWTTYPSWPPAAASATKYLFEAGGKIRAGEVMAKIDASKTNKPKRPETEMATLPTGADAPKAAPTPPGPDDEPAPTAAANAAKNNLEVKTQSSQNKDFDTYISDPARPVPYTQDVHLRRTREYMCDDQRFASRRPDVLVYETPVLSSPLTVTGPVLADLWVSLSTTDADFVVKLIDVFPDTMKGSENGVPLGGYQMLVRGEIFRGRYRNSFEQPEAFVPGLPTQVKFELPDVAHTFMPGHQLMIQIQSSWFPLADRNPQQFINIYEARDEDFVPAQIQVWHNSQYQSGVILPIKN